MPICIFKNQIGKNANKAGVRKTIKSIIKKSKQKNIIAFVVSLVIVIAFTVAII